MVNAASTMGLRRIAFVTGAAQGIGRTVALRLARDGLGVAVIDLPSKRKQLGDVVSEIKDAQGQPAIALMGDVSNEADMRRMTESAVEHLGGLDVMVANAGINHWARLIDQSSVETWDKILLTNLRGAMLSYKYAALHMIRQGRGGRIIGASSLAGKRGMDGGASAYAASKFGIRGLTQCAALELARHKITVNAYAPGIIDTGRAREEAATLPSGVSLSEHFRIPGHIPPPEDPEVVASLVSYLAKPEAYFITGQTVTVDGGVHFD